MRNLRYILIALTALTLSCQREEIKPEPKVLAAFDAVAEAPEQTKVSIDANYILSWEAGDKIKIWDGAVETLFIAEQSGKKTSFEAEGVVIVPEKTYVAAYPEEMVSFTSEALTVNVPAVVTSDPDDFPVAPAVAVSNGTDKMLEFRNVCGLISFNVVGNNIVSVTIEGGNGEVLAGYVNVDPDTAEYSQENILEPSTSMELKGLLSGLYPGKYYVPMLPNNFEKGLTLKMHTNSSTVIERTFEPFELKRSFYYDLEGIDIGRYFRYEISTAEDLQQFLDDAKDCKSHVVATLVRDVDLKGVELTSAESFAGTFNGNGKSLKNWTAKGPLFKNLSKDGVVRNLTIAQSCTYELSETALPQAFIVGVNEGLVTACTNKGSVSYTLSNDQAAPVDRTFGSIVGVCYSKMTDCVNYGNIDITLAAQTGAQHIGGVVGAFNSSIKSVAVEECTNEGKITVITQKPHNVNVGGVCAHGCDVSPKVEAVSVGAISNCINKAQVRVAASAACANVGGVIGYMEGNVSSCVNESAGEVTLAAYEGTAVSAPAVGGVVGTVVAGSVTGSSNAAAVSLAGAVQAASEIAPYTGGNVDPAIGGVVAKIGKAAEDTSLKIEDSKNTGSVNAGVEGEANLSIGGIVGWTSVPVVGTAANTLLNNGPITVSQGSQMAQVNVGGVIGNSISTFDKIYNGEAGSVTVSLPDTRDCAVRVAGIAGYMEKLADNTFKQGNNKGAVCVSGGEKVISLCFVAGVVAETKAQKVTSNSTSWDTSNSNYGDITVNSPVKLCVGGTLGRIGAMSGGDGATTRCKNRGNITVDSPKAGSCIGGVIGMHGRGKLGDANNCGVADDPVTIKVTNASKDVYVGGYVGQVNTNNGPNYPSCCTTISGFGIYGSISAPDATAGVIAGNVKMSGKSTTNGIMISSNGQNVRIAKDCKINDFEVGDLTKNPLSAFIASITPSTETTKKKTDETPLKNTYYICSYGGTTESSFPYGFTNY